MSTYCGQAGPKSLITGSPVFCLPEITAYVRGERAKAWRLPVLREQSTGSGHGDTDLTSLRRSVAWPFLFIDELHVLKLSRLLLALSEYWLEVTVYFTHPQATQKVRSFL